MGYLKESIDFIFKNDGLTGVVSVGADYAIYIEYGTGIEHMSHLPVMVS